MRKRKLLSVILALSLCLTLLPGMAAAEETGTATEVTSSEELTDTLAGSAETVRLGANITITTDDSLTVSRTVTLDLNGCVLKMTNNGGSVIKVDSGGNLKLTDSDTNQPLNVITNYKYKYEVVDGEDLTVIAPSIYGYTMTADSKSVVKLTGVTKDETVEFKYQAIDKQLVTVHVVGMGPDGKLFESSETVTYGTQTKDVTVFKGKNVCAECIAELTK